MTTTIDHGHSGVTIPPPPPGPRMQWRRAWRSLRTLLADPEDTEKAIDFFYAIGRRDFERSFQRFAASPAGSALLAERPSLRAALSDRAALAAMPHGSLGRAYLAYLDQNGFEPTGLLDLQDRVEARWEREESRLPLDDLRRWYRERSILAHDLFHVLSGYDTDGAGEGALLAFTLAQLGGRAQALLTLGATVEGCRHAGATWLRFMRDAWHRGRHAASLMIVPFEDVLHLDLETVRQLVDLEPTASAHPEGVPHFDTAPAPAG
jgi:ubiquinone biosynthesis protein COQ4